MLTRSRSASRAADPQRAEEESRVNSHQRGRRCGGRPQRLVAHAAPPAHCPAAPTDGPGPGCAGQRARAGRRSRCSSRACSSCRAAGAPPTPSGARRDAAQQRPGEACGTRPPARATAVILARGQIRAQRNSLLALADRLESPQPACSAGIAIAQWLITDALASPLYVESDPQALGHLARNAIANMDARAAHVSG